MTSSELPCDTITSWRTPPGESLWGVDVSVLLDCVTRCLWAATGKTRASVGPAASDLATGVAAALALEGVMTALPKQRHLSL